MEVIVHYPEAEDAKNELKKTAARVHADLIGTLIGSLSLSARQKCALIQAITEEYCKTIGEI